MIKVKLYDSSKMDIEECRRQKITLYGRKTFLHIVEGYSGEEEKEPPFGDADSLRFIHEIDKAEFVGGEDWYSIVTPYGRTNVTALCGGTQYALILIDNSRRGLYTDISDFGGYGEDIFRRLATVSIDILIAYDVKKVDGNSPELPILTDYMIENYPHEGGTVEAYVSYANYARLHLEDGKYHTGRYLNELKYDWYHEIGGLLAMAGKLIQDAGGRYRCPPLAFSVPAFAETMDERYANAFYEMEYPFEKECLEGAALPEQEYRVELEKLQQTEAYQEYVFLTKECRILSYLSKIPTEPCSKYPIHLMVSKEPDGKCILQEISTVKYPTYSEMLVCNEVLEFGERKSEIYVMVLDAESFRERERTLEEALWGVRNMGSRLELYDGIGVLEEFVKEVKEPYESGNLYVVYRDLRSSNGRMIRERADKHD